MVGNGYKACVRERMNPETHQLVQLHRRALRLHLVATRLPAGSALSAAAKRQFAFVLWRLARTLAPVNVGPSHATSACTNRLWGRLTLADLRLTAMLSLDEDTKSVSWIQKEGEAVLTRVMSCAAAAVSTSFRDDLRRRAREIEQLLAAASIISGQLQRAPIWHSFLVRR